MVLVEEWDTDQEVEVEVDPGLVEEADLVEADLEAVGVIISVVVGVQVGGSAVGDLAEVREDLVEVEVDRVDMEAEDPEDLGAGKCHSKTISPFTHLEAF